MKARIRAVLGCYLHKGWDHETALRKTCIKLEKEWGYRIAAEAIYCAARCAGGSGAR